MKPITAARAYSVARLVVVISASAILLTACGGGSNDASRDNGESAVDAFRRQIGYHGDEQYGRAWDELHPAQQALISREEYILCAGEVYNGVDADINEVIETYEEDITIPGTSMTVESTAITADVTISRGIFENESTETTHQILVDGEWRWILADPDAC